MKFWAIFGILVLVNFGVQGVDFLAMKINACGFYYFNPNCMDWNAFLLNKLLRIAINIVLIWMIFSRAGSMGKNGMVIVLSILAMGMVDVFLLQNNHFVSMRIHEFMHPIAFSPFVAIVLIIFGLQSSMKTKV